MRSQSTGPVPDTSLDFLTEIDSPTIANAIEPFGVRDRTEGFIGGRVQCQFPELGSMVGRALTVTMSNAPGEPASRHGYWQMWDALDAMTGPSVIVVADASGEPHRVAYAGEVMTTIAMRLGAVGMVTDGTLRDVAEVRALGFHYFMKYPVVSHANFSVTSVGEDITLDGQLVKTGDILHGDQNGIVIVPESVLGDLPESVADVRQKEAATMEYVRSSEFSYAELRSRSDY